MELITIGFIRGFISKNEMKLSCTQPRLCIPIINRIYRKMFNGVKFSEIKVDSDLICDGHHRYLASLFAQCELGVIPSQKTSATQIIAWDSVVFEESDWDSYTQIKNFNRQDAEYNGISVEVIEKFLV